jgi:hypothetical protein
VGLAEPSRTLNVPLRGGWEGMGSAWRENSTQYRILCKKIYSVDDDDA